MLHHSQSYYHDHKKELNPVGLFLCITGLISIAFSITLRVIPNAIPVELLALLNTTPQILSQVNASYQYSLIATLVLSGLFVDIIGPRTVLAIALLVAAVANFIFVKAGSVGVVLNSRVIIGYTHPFILTSVLTLGTHWLPRRHFSLFVGFLFGILLMMPVLMAPILQNITTRHALKFFILVVDMIGILVIIAIVLTERIIDRTRHRHDLAGLFRPLKHYKVWLISLVSMIGWMANTFVLQYGPYYLIRQFHFNVQTALSTIDTTFIFFGCGAIFMGLFSDYMHKKRFLIAGGYLLAALIFSVLFFTPHLPVAMAAPLLFAAAFFTSSTIICYTKANDYCTIGNSGITLGLVLSITTIGSSFFARSLHHMLLQYVNVDSAYSDHFMMMILAIIPLILIVGSIISLTMLIPTHHHDHTHPDRHHKR